MRYSDYKEAKETFNNIVKEVYGEISKYDMIDFIEWAMKDKQVQATGYQLGAKQPFPFDIYEMIKDYIDSQKEFYMDVV
jgi:hypothetical protein